MYICYVSNTTIMKWKNQEIVVGTKIVSTIRETMLYYGGRGDVYSTYKVTEVHDDYFKCNHLEESDTGPLTRYPDKHWTIDTLRSLNGFMKGVQLTNPK